MLQTIGIIAVCLVVTFAYIYHQKVKTKLEAEVAKSSDLFTKLLLSEQIRNKTEAELEFLKASIVQMLQRPVQAMLEDRQIATMTKALHEYWGKIYLKN